MKFHIPVIAPNEDVTHIEVKVAHRNKQVVLYVGPVIVGGGFVKTRLYSGRSVVISEMARYAPKRFSAECDAIIKEIETQTGITWQTILDVCKSVEAEVEVVSLEKSC